ncbi:blue-light-activated histidine kinase [mine drainage metagenome]|uniref:histidine kinase n=1 Tax=mine drainage metagenome TaxID=410659 RepID=A0A1J5SIW0_9ZZZZ
MKSRPRSHSVSRASEPAQLAGLAASPASGEPSQPGSLPQLELACANSLLRATLDATTDGILVVDASGRVVICNRRFASLWHSSENAVTAMGRDQLLALVRIHLRNPEVLEQTLLDPTSAPPTGGGEPLRFVDGRVFEHDSRPHPIDGDGVGRFFGFRDITERQRTEEWLRVQSSAISAAADAIVITDALGTIQSVNPSFTAITGYRSDEVIGRNPRILKSGRQDDAFYQTLWRTINAGEVWRGELVNRRKDGVLYTEQMSIAPMRGPDGRIAHFIAVKRDVTHRRAAEAALRQSEERFRYLAENTPDWIWEVDEQMRYTYVSQGVAKLLGYSPDDIVGKTPFDLMPPEEVVRVREALHATVANRAPFQALVNTNLHRDGTLVVLETTGVPFFDHEGRWLGYRGIDRDITERKRAEEALRASDEKFHDLADNIADVFWMTDPKMTKILFVNRAFETIWGRSCESAYADPTNFIDNIHPDDKPAVFAALEGLLEHGKFECEYRVVRPDGSTRWVLDRSFPVKDEAGRLLRLTGIAQDITERKAAEESLRLLGAAMEQARESIIIMTEPAATSGPRIQFVNPAFTTLTGYAAGEAVGRTPDIFHGPLTSQALLDDIAAHLSQGESFRGDGINYRKNGTPFDVELNIAPIRNADGRITHTIVIQHDVTERKRAYALLRQGRERLDLALDAAGMGVWEWTPADGRIAWSPECVEILGEAACQGTLAALLNAANPEDQVQLRRMFQETPGCRARVAIDFRLPSPEGITRWISSVGRASLEGNGGPHRVVGTIQDITERKRVEEELSTKTALLEAQVDASIDGLLFVDLAQTKVIQNDRLIELFKVPPEIAADSRDESLLNHVLSQIKDPGAFLDRVMYLYAHPRESSREEIELTDGTVLDRYSAPVLGKDGRLYGRIWGFRDITARKQAEAALKKSTEDLIELSRQAGMAEVATGVLHNVGNVLNSVNVSATLVADHVRHSQAASVASVAALLAEHRSSLPDYLTADPQGSTIPDYLATLSESLAEEKRILLSETDELRKNIEHIRDVIAMQQSYAKTSGIIESVSLTDLVDDALRINAGTLARHDVKIMRDYQSQAVIATDKHKVMLILINLIRNAKYACDESGRADKEITVTVTTDERGADILIRDNGIGIPEANLALLFSHGFTTKTEGHGFGLHSSALAARELGGSLAVQSDGPGRGALFQLHLPSNPETP